MLVGAKNENNKICGWFGVAKTWIQLQKIVEKITMVDKEYGMRINTGKFKLMRLISQNEWDR